MIDLDAALELVERAAAPLRPRRMPLAMAAGRRLAAAIEADGDAPPWDRAMMDGFALRAADVGPDGSARLDVVVDLAAGDVTTLVIPAGGCARIMTGAPLPAGADTVVPVERAVAGTGAVHAGGEVRLHDRTFRAGQHVARKGSAFRCGDRVLDVGSLLTPAAIGLAVEAGATHVVAAPRPRVAILSTGSELVAPHVVPGHGRIRNSNGPMIHAAVVEADGDPVALGIAPDRPEAIRAAVAQGLAADVLVVSGGVSAGDLDLVPSIFSACGVEPLFHKVRLKPGKPVWFGRRRRDFDDTLVFGLPGNPASSLVCFDLFVRPALAMLAGRPRGEWHLPRVRARLAAAARGAGDRPVYAPCRLRHGAAGLEAVPLPWSGSSDLVGLAVAEGLSVVPEGTTTLAEGAMVDVVLRGNAAGWGNDVERGSA